MLLAPTLFEAGSELHLEFTGRWFYAHNPLTGQFPAYYERSARVGALCTWARRQALDSRCRSDRSRREL